MGKVGRKESQELHVHLPLQIIFGIVPNISGAID